MKKIIAALGVWGLVLSPSLEAMHYDVVNGFSGIGRDIVLRILSLCGVIEKGYYNAKSLEQKYNWKCYPNRKINEENMYPKYNGKRYCAGKKNNYSNSIRMVLGMCEAHYLWKKHSFFINSRQAPFQK
ncbi:hypothetical protein FACS1894126_2260 [Alphaproteobacteria bacterium]|nr:hypothetical protein FACS1894126_2260 [Alphaproteobacteria bacterium]